MGPVEVEVCFENRWFNEKLSIKFAVGVAWNAKPPSSLHFGSLTTDTPIGYRLEKPGLSHDCSAFTATREALIRCCIGCTTSNRRLSLYHMLHAICCILCAICCMLYTYYNKIAGYGDNRPRHNMI